MNTVRQTLDAIHALPLPETVRILNLSGHHERVIVASGMRQLLPEAVELLSGPGCAASICPEADLYQAIRLSQDGALTLLVGENLIDLPLGTDSGVPRSLSQAQREGADVRTVSAPIEAILQAEANPQRQMILFAAGYETLLAPLAGMVVEGLPDNLSVLLCGRRVEPLLELLLDRPDSAIDALLLPGNRCALLGTRGWENLSARHHIAAAVAGYTSASILSALHAVLDQHCKDEARVDNLYRAMVRPEGNPMAVDQLERVFALATGHWRGLGSVEQTAYRWRNTYRVVDADQRFTDFRDQMPVGRGEMPPGCECAAVVLGERTPQQCLWFSSRCEPESPHGPCMASDDGTCKLHSD